MGTKTRTWDIRSALVNSVISTQLEASRENAQANHQNIAKRWQNCSTESLDQQDWPPSPEFTPELNDEGLTTADSIAFIRKSDPRAGGTYLILDVARNRALTCHQGQVRLEPISLDNKNISEKAQWSCTERNGFKGFQNVAGGGFLGHDVWWHFRGNASAHSLWESFTIARRDGGLYWLQILHWWTQWQVSASEEGNGVYPELEGGTSWEFVKVLNMGDGI
ncbi:hypothetical protein NW752_009442 [Fusarium irregulare]|uniref:Uncharacterized protein n=1 Tax=Fusarium irregulare TaxID=2494466 RepID=A0A9W8PD30_9HYPO|nr:hypothetical protein NW766_012720 [Fusarium irregulare]KAJ4009145.1 hypothetical protein NW752_009442 [Fusarium irregulare]